jgi:hypothetical protein
MSGLFGGAQYDPVVSRLITGVQPPTWSSKPAKCKHPSWTDPEKIASVKPYDGEIRGGMLRGPETQHALERLMVGSVTYQQRCTVCEVARTYEVLGEEARDA